jgi:diguanylate cyclase (GGDEF)-like protein
VRDRPLGGISVGRRGTLMFSIVRIRPHGPISGIPRGVNRYLVMAKKVDYQVVAQVAHRSDSRRLSLAARPGPGRASWRFASFDGDAARSFQWDAKRPGLDLFGAVAPLLALLIAMIGGLAALVLRRARKAARELMASETRARYLASRDPLTGLANRRAFNDHLVELNRRGRRHALMFLDLDGFKKVNDTFGHGVGDKLLCRTAERLQRVLPPDAFLARLGGDEFASTVPQPGRADDVETLAARLIETVGEPHQFGGEPTTVGVSIGIAASEAGKYDEVVRHADMAMYVAKQRGRNRWQHFDHSLEKGREERRRLELDLKQALDRREIFVLFQPIVDAQSGRIITVEALARWTHPTMGPISPDVFIPIAEESGLIVELGQQILEQACVAARNWPYRLAVNLSPAQFWEGNLVAQVIATLARLNFPPRRLKFEITENYLLSQPDAADAVIRDLRRHGIRIALDDFGTGYASIGYLRRFQFDLVKIDRSLVEAVTTDPAAADVLLAIVSLCRALGLPILAEGVETAEQAAMLRANGCKYLQGWHFGRPVSARAIDAIAAAQCRNVA